LALAVEGPAEDAAGEQTAEMGGVVDVEAGQEIHDHGIADTRHCQALPLGVAVRVAPTCGDAEQPKNAAADTTGETMTRQDEVARQKTNDACTEEHDRETQRAQHALRAAAQLL
jgi:hypothetical protein